MIEALPQLDLATRVVFGADSLAALGPAAVELGARRALVVSDPGVTAVGHPARAREVLEAAGIAVTIFSDVHENPTTDDVDRCRDAARAATADLLVAVGGGSSIDTARGANFLLTSGGRMQDYWGVGKATAPMLPFVAVPTTTGTGSEMQSFALIADPRSHQKMACGDPRAAARVAILDPTLSATQPRSVVAHTGLDCLSHAVESAVTRRHTPFSRLFSREAARLALAFLPRVLERPADVDAQGSMLLASAFAGIAIEHSMLGAAHSLANPLTAHYDVVHGEAVGMMLPHVVRFNAEDEAARAEYAHLGRLADDGLRGADDHAATDALVRRIEDALLAGDAPATLAECGVPADALAMLADEASRQWTAQFNPRAVAAPELRALYEAAFEGSGHAARV